MSLNSLKIATSGYLKRQTKAALIIAVSGYLNFQEIPVPPTPPTPSKPQHVTGFGGGGGPVALNIVFDKNDKRAEAEASDIIAIVELTLKHFII